MTPGCIVHMYENVLGIPEMVTPGSKLGEDGNTEDGEPGG